MTIDVVVPTTGRPALRRLLAALAEGGDLPDRILLVDDRRAPASPLGDLVAPALAARTTVVRSGGRGPAAARNAGWRASSADWIAFLDDDVVPAPDWLARLRADLAALPDAVAASQGRLEVPVSGRPTDWERNVAGLAHAAFITADMAMRRPALAAAHGFDERFPRAYREDAELALRLRRAGWEIASGTRRVLHPVPAAGRLVSVGRQRGNRDDALMRALHGAGWREAALVPRGRRRRHLAATAAALAALGLRRRAAGRIALALWVALTADFAAARIRPGPRTADELLAMTVTSALIPPVASANWLAGVARWRVLERPRPLPTAGPGG